MPLRLEAEILSRMRSPVTSRSNWANDSSTFRVSRPIELVVLNCCVIETKEAPWPSRISTILAKSARAGQTIDLVDNDDVYKALLQVRHQTLDGRPFHGATREAAIVVGGFHQLPALVRLTPYICLTRLPLGVQGIKRLFQSLLRGLSGVDGAPADRGRHAFASLRRLKPKNAGPDQRLPVIR